MNKLLVSDIIKLESGTYFLQFIKKDIIVEINGDVVIYLINEIFNKLTIRMQENSKLSVYNFKNVVNNKNWQVFLEQSNNSVIYYNEANITNRENNLIINNDIKGNNNESYINIRNISNKELNKIIINVFIDKNTKNNIALEDLKGINNGGFIHIEPNIEALSNEVVANHLTTIGSLDQNTIDYLMSKGIDESVAKDILLKGFIFSNMDNTIKEKIGGE